MNPLLKFGLVFGVAVSTITGSYIAGSHAGKNKEALSWREKQVELGNEIAGLQAKLRDEEEAHETEIRAIEADYLAEEKKNREEQELIIDALRDGNIKLRDSLKKRPVCERVPTDTESPSGDYARAETGLSNDDAEFLIRFAGQCDEVVGQLTAAQEFIKTINER